MQRRHVTWATWASGVSLFAAADTALGTGAVMALAELCLTDGAYDAVLPTSAMPSMPMEHTGHVMPWLISGTLLGSVAGFGGWTIARRDARDCLGAATSPNSGWLGVDCNRSRNHFRRDACRGLEQLASTQPSRMTTQKSRSRGLPRCRPARAVS